MSPEGMLERLEKDMEKGNEKLQNMSCDFLRDKDGLNLREYQIRAIHGIGSWYNHSPNQSGSSSENWT